MSWRAGACPRSGCTPFKGLLPVDIASAYHERLRSSLGIGPRPRIVALYLYIAQFITIQLRISFRDPEAGHAVAARDGVMVHAPSPSALRLARRHGRARSARELLKQPHG